MSTSRDRSYALTFANKLNDHEHMVPVLFEIDCYLHDYNNSIVYADISSSSIFPGENEFLFDANSIFQIENIMNEKENDMSSLYTIHIRTPGKTQNFGQMSTKQNQNQNKNWRLETFFMVLKRMGRFKKTITLLQYLAENSDGSNIANNQNETAVRFEDKNNYEDILSSFTETFALIDYSKLQNDKYLAYIFHKLGQTYAKQKDYKRALQYDRCARNIIGMHVGDINASIEWISPTQKELKEALKYQLIALQTIEYIRPDDIRNSSNYVDIENTYFNLGNYQEAFKYDLKALELREKHLSPDHEYIAKSLCSISQTFYKMNNLHMAYKYYIQSLQIIKNYPDTNSQQIRSSLSKLITLIHDDYCEEFLQFRLNLLTDFEKRKPVSYSNLIRAHNDIAFTYQVLCNKKEALEFY